MSYIRREESLETMAARAIGEGSDFGHTYARTGLCLTSHHRRTLPQTLARLECGEVLDARDDDCIAAMGDALVAEANAISPGYGNRVLNVCTYEDFLFDEKLEELRWMILRWDSFSRVRMQVRGRLAARRLLVSVQCSVEQAT
ncbi:hypothetical protein [Sulfitobacter sp.]|jgi:hypothetical protein|uniref:hypothetical protein n=1 Tax=Sulfitobacter sp. TaxID=1903071 RepID=UPI0039E51A2B